MKTVRFRAIGRVQGVYYRAWTQQTAESLGVCGWVRNVRDGTVEGVAAGEPAAVDALLSAMRDGPEHALVRAVQSAPHDAEPFERFVIESTEQNSPFVWPAL